MTLSPGARLGPYEIQAAIGARGMGEVYKAKDTRHDRSVAIKVVPREVSADPDRRARFERESKTSAGNTAGQARHRSAKELPMRTHTDVVRTALLVSCAVLASACLAPASAQTPPQAADGPECLLLNTSKTATLQKALMAAWVHGYATTLRPRLKEQRFRTPATARHDLRERLRDTFAERALPWTLTGAAGTLPVDRFLETADTRVYVPRDVWTPELLRALRLQPAVNDGDLVAIEAPGPLALEAVTAEGWPCAALPLVYAELRYLDTDQTREAADRLMPRLLEVPA